MKKPLLLLIVLLSVISCSIEKDLYQEPIEKEGGKDFSLTDKINVTSDLPEKTRCLLYTSDPTDENNASDPVMVAYAPFSLKIPVAKAVDKLYSSINGEVKEHKRGNITLTAPAISRSAKGTRAEDDETPLSHTYTSIDDAFLTAIYSYYPEAIINVYGEDLKKSSDLVAPQGVKETITLPNGGTNEIMWGNTKMWITYIGNSGSNIYGDLWYYTYEVDDSGTPTTPLSEIEANKVPIFQQAHPDNEPPADAPGKKVYLGEFEPGTHIGFKFQGNALYNDEPYPKYSTPYYNAKAYENRTTFGKWTNTYKGKKITGYCQNFKDNKYTCGVIRLWNYKGVEYATLGMENRLPSEKAWDGDFNDMMCLLESNSLQVENTIDPPETDPTTVKFGGYWLFEDNYPNEGDYDFNDFVVKYAIKETQGQETIIDLQFMARGASKSNSFGINGKIYFEDLGGYENVSRTDEAVKQPMHQIMLQKADNYIPMMNNGTHTFNLNTYNEENEDFPCVLEIPIVNQSKFLWCIESKRIDDAYPSYKLWVESNCLQHTDWYLETPVSDLVWDK